MLVALALYAVLAVASFMPQSLRPWDTVAYIGDSTESVYIVDANVRQFFSNPLRIFDAPAFHPYDRTIAFTDHRLLPSLVVAPVLWATGNPVLAYNVSLLLGCLLAAMAARHLALLFGADAVAAWAAGALYAFHTYQVNEGPRLNIFFHGFIPLVLACLVRYLRSGRAREAWGVAAFMLLQGLSSNYHLLYGVLFIGLVVAGVLVARPALALARIPKLALAGAVAAALYAPVAFVYLSLSGGHGYSRGLPTGIDVVHFFSTTPTNLFYGAIGTTIRLGERGPHFLGFVSLGLAALALFGAARRRLNDPGDAFVPARVWVAASAALLVLCLGLALGRDFVAFGHHLGPGPYRLLFDFVPGFHLVRYPERFGLPAMLFLGLLVARGLMLVKAAGYGRLAMLFAALVPLEHVSPLVRNDRIPVGAAIPAVYEWLATQPAQAVIDLPFVGEAMVRDETMKMYFANYHQHRIVNGLAGFEPLLTRLTLRLCATFPSETSLQVLQRLGVDTVVLHYGLPLGRDVEGLVPNELSDHAERFAHLLRVADLDTYDQVPGAVADGRLVRLARFEGKAARLFESTADEVFRLRPGAPVAAAPFPTGRRLLRSSWSYRTKAGDPLPAADGDLSTVWSVPRQLNGDEFFEITFDRPERVSGVVLPLVRDSQFPTRFRVLVRTQKGAWKEAARFDMRHALQLVDSLLGDAKHAALGFALPGAEITGVTLSIEEAGTSHAGWRLPEVEVWTR
jgi:hypothetical protein